MHHARGDEWVSAELGLFQGRTLDWASQAGFTEGAKMLQRHMSKIICLLLLLRLLLFLLAVREETHVCLLEARFRICYLRFPYIQTGSRAPKVKFLSILTCGIRSTTCYCNPMERGNVYLLHII